MAWAPFDGAHWSRPAVEGTQDFTYYGQQVSRLTPAGGPTAGGTRVLVSGGGFAVASEQSLLHVHHVRYVFRASSFADGNSDCCK